MEKLTMHSNEREENLGEVVLQVFGAILVVVGLYIAGNLLLGLN